MMRVYQPPLGVISTTVWLGRSPKNSSVSRGWRWMSRALSGSGRWLPAMAASSAVLTGPREEVLAQPAAANHASASTNTLQLRGVIPVLPGLRIAPSRPSRFKISVAIQLVLVKAFQRLAFRHGHA